MSVYVGLLGAALGIAISLGALVMVVVNSPLIGGGGSLRGVYLWSIVFLLGVFVFGYSLARFAGA